MEKGVPLIVALVRQLKPIDPSTGRRWLADLRALGVSEEQVFAAKMDGHVILATADHWNARLYGPLAYGRWQRSAMRSPAGLSVYRTVEIHPSFDPDRVRAEETSDAS